ncbi:MAG: sigma-70 family RNA polymerase sigma factor [Myxococcales bacterium]|nr:sigma-70 family RNA polymerase sigma factor [Myxococcales bacterium]
MLAPSQPIADSPEPISDLIRHGKHREAIAACAAEYGRSVGRLCMAMLGNQDEADEVAQESFLAAYQGMANYRGEGSLRAWLYGIARRQCARRLERGPRRHLELVVESHASSDDPEASMVQARRASDMRRQLADLKPTERDALVLRFAGDLSFKEVADILNIGEAVARKRASRGLLRLRTTLRPEDVE